MSTSAASRPQSGAAGTRSTRPAQRSGQEGLVRSAPKAKQRRARLLVSRIDLWSALKLGFLLSVALGVITVIGAVGLYSLMDLAGIFDRINDVLGTVLGATSGNYTVQHIAPLGTVASLSTIVAVLNVLLVTLLSVVLAALYNVSTALVGGLGVTLTDD